MIDPLLLVDGDLVPAADGATFTTSNPATEEVLGEVADASDVDLDRALDGARVAFDTTDWSRDHAFRAHCLRQLQAAMETHADELRALTVAEVGAPVFLTSGAHLDAPVADLGWFADLAEQYAYRTDLGEAAPMGVPSRRWVLKEAAGVVGAITPWNFPNQINLAKVGPALAAGCTVILKPAPDTPGCATALARLAAEETDLPDGVLNVITSTDHGLGARLATDPRVDVVSFTGSTATGRSVMAGAAQTLKRVFLELGGKSAFIVLDDADLGAAAAMAAFTVSTHAGQGCAITTRLVVPRGRYDEAVEAAAATLTALGCGDPTDPGTVCGPVISGTPTRPHRGLPGPGGGGGRPVRGRGRPAHRPGPGPLDRADAGDGAGQLGPGGPRGDLRSGAGGHPPRRRRRRGGHRQRLALRAVRSGAQR